MKPTQLSFLLLFYVVLQLCCITNQNVYAQKTTDSTDYRSLILNPKNISDLTRGYTYYLNSKDLKLKNSDTLGAIYDLRLLSIALKKKGLFYESENYAIEALLLLDYSKDIDTSKKEAKVGLYNHLGLINKALEKYDLAINYFKKVIANADKIENKNTGIKNLASVYSKTKDYTKAIKSYLSVLEYTKANESPIKLARLIDNLGFAQSKIKDSNALINLNKALAIRKEAKHYSGLITSYLHLADYYNAKNDIKKALDYANKALEISKKSKNKYYEMNALAFKISLNDNAEVVRYKTLNDSIEHAKQMYKNQFASRKYEFLKEKKRADKNELLREKEKSKKIMFQSVAALILLLMVFIVIRQKDKHKKDKLEQVYTTESKISKRIHDEIANDLFLVMNTLDNNATIGSGVIKSLDDLYYKTRDISQEHSIVDTNNNYIDNLKALIDNFNDANTNIILKGISEVNWAKCPEIQKITIYKVLQELLINMKKHSKASLVVLVFKYEKNKIQINYSDNGIGCQLVTGNGLANTENRIKAIKGTINFETEPNKGFKAKISI